MRPHAVITTAIAGLALTACAMQDTGSTMASSPGSGAQCFRSGNITSFSDAGPNTALVHIGTRESWELELAPGCPNVDYAMRLGVVSRGGTRICTGVDAELLVPNAGGRGLQRCLVRSVRKLSPEEAAAARGLKPLSR